MTRACALAVVIALGAAVLAAPASGDVFGTISLVSDSALQQADFAHDPALSADGRYVVFDGSFGGVRGVWRRDLQTGVVEQVAGGNSALPSTSADGRWVSFTTTEGASLATITDGLPHEGSPEAANVYVRDMTRPPGEPGAFTVVSAPSHSEQPLTYTVTPEEGASEGRGSVAAGRTAISADGSKVAFVTTAMSNLVAHPQIEAEELEHGETPRPRTPSLQVAVRDITTATTELVSVRRDPATGLPAISPETGEDEPVPTVFQEGAIDGAVAAKPADLPFSAPAAYGIARSAGASISGDGSTVAWMAQQLQEQVAYLPGEQPQFNWTAPVWRRIADGPGVSTRPVTGGADPENPLCQASGEQQLPGHPVPGDPCQGPFETQRTVGISGNAAISSLPLEDNNIPQLSSDGYTVVFLATAPPVALEGADVGDLTDAYLADMHPGLTRTQALRPLTEPAGTFSTVVESALATNAPITDVAISPEASLAARTGEVAFTTDRIVFALGSPSFVSSRAAVPGMNELYDVDLANDTLTRVTQGYEGGPSEHPFEHGQAGVIDPFFFGFGIDDGALSPSFAAGGDQLAFSSTASNLSFGDDNTPQAAGHIGHSDGSDAFLINRIQFHPEEPEQSISAIPSNPIVEASWTLGVTAESLRDGRVRLFIRAPAAGTLRASANGAVPVKRRARTARGRARYASVVKTVAATSASARSGFQTVLLALGKTYRPLALRKGGIAATAVVTFLAPGHAATRARVRVRFAAHRQASSSHKGSGSK
jgi:hypothetical protein